MPKVLIRSLGLGELIKAGQVKVKKGKVQLLPITIRYLYFLSYTRNWQLNLNWLLVATWHHIPLQHPAN